MGTYRPWLCVSLSMGGKNVFPMPKFKFIRLSRHNVGIALYDKVR